MGGFERVEIHVNKDWYLGLKRRKAMKLSIPICVAIYILKLQYMADCSEECSISSPLNEDRPDWFYVNFTSDYNKRMAPKTDGNPADVEVKLELWKIGRLSFEEMTFEADFMMGLYWTDFRITVPENVSTQIALSDREAAKVWLPVVSFRNAVGSDGVTFDPKIHRLKIRNHSLFYNSRHVVRFHCNYDLFAFPMDIQKCTIEIQNSAGDNKCVMSLLDGTKTHKLFSNSLPPDFAITKMETGTCKRDDGMSTYRSCVEYSFILHRHLAFHLMMTYAPSILIVILSWLSFWLNPNCTAPRVALGVTSLLTLATQFANVQRNLPPVAYVKSIDIWMFVCMLQVFGTLVEFTVVHCTIQSHQLVQVASKQPKISYKNTKEVSNKDEVVNSRIDKLSRFAFFLTFVVFNIVYWSYYLSL